MSKHSVDLWAMKEKLGFSLDLRPSNQADGQAGNGLWLDGSAQLGAIVALYPGFVYSPLAYRCSSDLMVEVEWPNQSSRLEDLNFRAYGSGCNS